uniref:Uncharacterized protein n=1 Tax=Noctiluca scintillans TaxID=2966 RepID=A0A7S1FCK6_NOCSC|mmetsp:Transcript_5332/g.15206  ORF Transcript_5332/g.15206 Transcript_5332/m.15206 type:complete len:142 (+) Transcript_5332:66-491(+)|eukprot:CAMPEP_0194518502 /NCGR_PEP_ID=MMETSP0253-20130528/51938_1 /TAXON_ID=2966 /ORGANISM="Noctiluca scintillans" /LENGTH=141 /DNA_ID=CAMNT_0039362551 /DNA_START=20 /DNA_END=445 /DNA_ORIENTATION=-
MAGTGEAPDREEDAWVRFQLDIAADQTTLPVAGTKPVVSTERLNTSREGEATGELGDIFKVQVAQGHPIMMVYDKTGDRKTFLHEGMPGFEAVHSLAVAEPKQKAFFWGRDAVDGDAGGDGADAARYIVLNVSKLAPTQPW